MWLDILTVQKYRDKLIRVHRKTVFRVIMEYRTISRKEKYMIEGIIPVELFMEERKIPVNKYKEMQ